MGTISFVILLILTYYVLWRMRGFWNIPIRDLLIGWSLKVLAAVLFVVIFSYYYSNGYIYGDAGNFLKDSKYIQLFAYQDPWRFIQLMCGVDLDTDFFNNSILAETNIWSYGENGDLMNDNRLIIRINTLIHFVSFRNVYVHGLIFSFLSFTGLLLLIKAFKKWLKNIRITYYLLVLFPSILFWGSGITKEAVLIVALGLFFYGILKFIEKPSSKFALIAIVGTFMLLLNKPHVGLIILGLSPLLLLGKFTNWKKSILWITPLVLVGMTIALTYTPSKINLLEKISYKQKDLINMGKGGVFFINDTSFCAFDYRYQSHFTLSEPKKIQVDRETPGEYKLFGQATFHPYVQAPDNRKYDLYLVQPPSSSFIEIPLINYNRWALLTSIPQNITTLFLRPFPWDGGKNIKYLALGSNLLMLFCLGFAWMNRRQLIAKEIYLIFFLILSAFITLLLIGWTTPILGAVVRYKMAAELLILLGLAIWLKPLNYEKN